MEMGREHASTTSTASWLWMMSTDPLLEQEDMAVIH
jgi:hypothetical protein